MITSTPHLYVSAWPVNAEFLWLVLMRRACWTSKAVFQARALVKLGPLHWAESEDNPALKLPDNAELFPFFCKLFADSINKSTRPRAVLTGTRGYMAWHCCLVIHPGCARTSPLMFNTACQEVYFSVRSYKGGVIRSIWRNDEATTPNFKSLGVVVEWLLGLFAWFRSIAIARMQWANVKFWLRRSCPLYTPPRWLKLNDCLPFVIPTWQSTLFVVALTLPELPC